MTNDDWYRHKTWDSQIEAAFEARLKKSRGAFHKAQYLRIQASCLLGSPDEKCQHVGLILMERLIKDFAEEHFSIIYGQEQLGDFYLKQNNYEKAEHFFRIVTNYYQEKKSRSGTTGLADLKLAKTILKSNQAHKFNEAYQIVTNYPVSELRFNNEIFYYAETAAHLCDAMGKKEEADVFARSALELSKIKEPQLTRHKDVGLIKVSEKQIQILRDMLIN